MLKERQEAWTVVSRKATTEAKSDGAQTPKSFVEVVGKNKQTNEARKETEAFSTAKFSPESRSRTPMEMRSNVETAETSTSHPISTFRLQ